MTLLHVAPGSLLLHMIRKLLTCTLHNIPALVLLQQRNMDATCACIHVCSGQPRRHLEEVIREETQRAAAGQQRQPAAGKGRTSAERQRAPK